MKTADLIDDYQDELDSCEIQFQNLGGKMAFYGPCRTIRCERDNGLVKKTLNSPGDGAVLIVDGGGSLYSALMGDMIAAAAVKNGWAGVIIHGVIRDREAIGHLDLGVKALGSNPRKSSKAGEGEVDCSLSFGGANFSPKHWVYADEDGIVVAQRALLS